jgi:dihydrodipicolinate synthase/N-acetylneuraminate lyase
MRRLVRFALDAGAEGIVCFGLAGEVSRLTVKERMALCEVIVGEVAGRVPVLVGSTGENLNVSQAIAVHAHEAGAAGLVLPPPTSYRLSPAHLIEFFAAVAYVTSLPVTVQDAPEHLGVTVGPETVLAVSGRAPNVRCVKVETGAEGIEAWRGALGEEFLIFGGNGGLFLLDCLRAGADGIMPGLDSVDFQVAIARAEREGHHAEADHLFERLLPFLVFEMQTIDHYNACAKYVLRRRGVLREIALRSPGPAGLSASSVARLEAYLDRLGFRPLVTEVAAR